ncbi:response regulator [Defluviitalea saccharophila]|uniref:Stage 0 sporulation protein A homolog n=1 Tax=Defluviitalea saccharophila TaxID=879970 RepID=A0ABZ2Y3Z0_9FIRM
MEKIVILMEDKKEKQDINELFRKENIEIYFGDDENGVLKILGEKDGVIDLIIIDMVNDPVKGLECISLIKGKYKYRNIPIVIIAQKEDVMKGLAIGAQEYIIPPYKAEEICDFIKAILNNKRNNEYAYAPQTSIDMTFEQYFNSEIKRAERGNYDLSILILTITSNHTSRLDTEKNRIEMINQLAFLVKENLRVTDTIMRYNKSNIIAFLPYTPRFNAEIVYEKILKVFEDKILNSYNEIDDWEIIYSIVSYPQDGENVKDLLFNAEQYLENNIAGR